MCVAIPGRVLSIGEATGAMVPAEVEFPGRTMTVNLVMLPEAAVGDHVIVHSGYAIRVVGPHEAGTPGR
jgi:hydrogenase expression/formation protein HypC